MTTHSYIRAQYLKLIGARFFIFVPGFVSRDFELGTVRPSVPYGGNFFSIFFYFSLFSFLTRFIYAFSSLPILPE